MTNNALLEQARIIAAAHTRNGNTKLASYWWRVVDAKTPEAMKPRSQRFHDACVESGFYF